MLGCTRRYAFLSRLKAQINAAKEAAPGSPSVHIVERSIYSDRLCFASNCFESGLLSEMEFTIYTDFHSFVAENFDALHLDGIIYLRAAPEVTHVIARALHWNDARGA